MKKLKMILSIAALLALTGCNVKIKGQWDPALPGHFIASTALAQDETYLIRNDTQGMIYLWLLDDRTPIQYFPLLPGDTRQFTAPGDGFDLFNASTVQGVSLWWIPN